LEEQKYVIVNNFKTTKESNGLESYLNKPNNDTTLLLIADTLDKRSSIFKLINDKGHIIIIDEVKDLSNKINHYAKTKNINIEYLAIQRLLEYNLENYDLVLNEIDKIAQYTNNITIAEVERYSSRLISEDNFEFTDAIINKNHREIQKHLDNFISLKLELTPFIALLAGQYRLMYATKCLEASNDEIAKKLNVHPYRIKLAKEKSLEYSKDELQKKLLDLCDLDYNIKSTSTDKYILFKIFILNL
jgi:DNA polymerase-3 subunit delta